MLAVLLWTGNTLVTKAAAGLIAPAAIAFYRWLGAGLVLTPFVARAVWQQRAVVRAYWPKLALLGALSMAAYQGLAYEAARTTSVVNMGIIVALMPLFSSLLSAGLAHESLTANRVGSALLSLAGLVVLTTHGQWDTPGNGALHRGDVLMVLAVGSNALYGVLLRRWALPLSTWQQLYVQVGFGTLVLLPFWLLAPASPLTMRNAPLVGYAALAASIGAPYCWIRGVKVLGPARASLFMNLLPVLVALSAWVLLQEPLHLFHAVGGGLALAGVWWGNAAAAK
ncbi:DMT family transporter [Hymenobacter glaciei]|uniref:DMT family transporter n=1 Tax=Hymenobacter glaciei TaxID=877209 RepID=A0ABP7UN88_9BACT